MSATRGDVDEWSNHVAVTTPAGRLPSNGDDALCQEAFVMPDCPAERDIAMRATPRLVAAAEMVLKDVSLHQRRSTLLSFEMLSHLAIGQRATLVGVTLSPRR